MRNQASIEAMPQSQSARGRPQTIKPSERARSPIQPTVQREQQPSSTVRATAVLRSQGRPGAGLPAGLHSLVKAAPAAVP